MRILVLGAGSIGQRHINNLKSMSGMEVAVCDVDRARLKELEKAYSLRTYADFGEALRSVKPEGVVISTPNNSHLDFSIKAVESGAHVFVEKPLSHELEGLDSLLGLAKKNKRSIFVGYNLRFNDGIKKVKKWLDSGVIGRIYSAQVEVGQYLPDWRPKIDYRKVYSSSSSQGGGILLDASHEIDYITWFLGEVKEVFCFAGKISDLNIDVEDHANILLKFKSGVVAQVSLDYLQRTYRRTCRLVGEKGTIIWDLGKREVKIYQVDKGEWEIILLEQDLNHMYLSEIKHFISCISGIGKPLINAEDGKHVLELVLAAKRSAKEGRLIKL